MNLARHSSEQSRIVVVVPTYNEREALPMLVEQIARLGQRDLHLLVVDDNSPDGTGRIADELAATHAWIEVLHRPGKSGLGRAYVAGMTRALESGADIVVQMDADLSHPVSSIPVMIETLDRHDAAVVIGSRYVPGGAVATDWPLTRRMLSRGANAYVDAILHLGINDATAGFKAWRSEALVELDLSTIDSNGYSFQVEMNHRVAMLGRRIVEVPITFIERAHGRSKMSLRVQLESARTPWLLRRRRPVSRPVADRVGARD